jgi:hypothetical protein
MEGNVEKYLRGKIELEGSIHITLIDPEKVTPPQACSIARKARASETSAIMVNLRVFSSLGRCCQSGEAYSEDSDYSFSE